MKITQLRIRGFRSFGGDDTVIEVEHKLIAFIGLNSSGKTTALDALRKIFGSSNAEREIFRHDFHFEKDEEESSTEEKTLAIEVRLEFTEKDKETIPLFFSQMIVEEEGGNPYIRIRLEATWNHDAVEPDGIIDSKLFFIKAADGEDVEEDNKQLYPNHLKSLIQIIYVPAIRRPAEQLRYASGSILYRVLRKIKWQDEFKETFDEKIDEINKTFEELPELISIQKSITSFWEKFHKDDRYKETSLGFGGSDLDSILKKLEISFTPTPTHRKFSVDDLGEGYRSLFYLTLVCALLDIEEKMADDDENIGLSQPLLTILAIEEPENHIAPQLLGRVIKILKAIAEKENSQVVLSSHTPAIVKRLDPEAIFHFRITEEYKTEVNAIILPDSRDDAFKYIKEAVHNYPEIYFARLAVIGEGDSEEVIFSKLMDVMKVDFDDNIITFAPLGHRFVNHIWKLLKTLHIPYITLLDLDLEREGGGWGRIKYALTQLIAVGEDKNALLALKDDKILSDEDFEEMHTWDIKEKESRDNLYTWVKRLKKYGVYFSAPLDLDFLMLQHYTDFYKQEIPAGGGPRIPDSDDEPDKFLEKVETAVKATLKSNEAEGIAYTEEEKQLMIWYNYHFLGRGKPSTHMRVLSGMTPEQITNGLPDVLKSIFKKISSLLNN